MLKFDKSRPMENNVMGMDMIHAYSGSWLSNGSGVVDQNVRALLQENNTI